MRYLFSMLWKHVFAVCAMIACVVAYTTSPEFTTFAFILLPVMVLAASATLAMHLLSVAEKKGIMSDGQALVISVASAGMLLTGGVISGRALLVIIPANMDAVDVFIFVCTAAMFGIFLGCCEIALPKIIKIFVNRE